MDERIKAYYDALVEEQSITNALADVITHKRARAHNLGKYSGLEYAIETFKSMFDLAEYAKGARDDRVDL